MTEEYKHEQIHGSSFGVFVGCSDLQAGARFEAHAAALLSRVIQLLAEMW